MEGGMASPSFNRWICDTAPSVMEKKLPGKNIKVC